LDIFGISDNYFTIAYSAWIDWSLSYNEGALARFELTSESWRIFVVYSLGGLIDYCCSLTKVYLVSISLYLSSDVLPLSKVLDIILPF